MRPSPHPVLPVLLLVGGLVAAAAQEVRHEPLILTAGGTAGQPAVFDGKDMIIDLGIDVTARGWRKAGDVWTAEDRLAAWDPVAPGICTGLWVDEVPMLIAIDKEAQAKRAKGDERNRYLPAERLAPGEMGCSDAGTVYFRWPAGKSPATARLYIPPKPGTSAVSIRCSHIIVRNLTAMHAANDGVNIHGGFTGIVVEHIRALSNADEGISAHDKVGMDVQDAEIAWNASYDGGVVDVGESVTNYRGCRVHDNPAGKQAAFKFFGGRHAVADIEIWNQKLDFRVNDGTVFTRERVVDRGFVGR